MASLELISCLVYIQKGIWLQSQGFPEVVPKLCTFQVKYCPPAQSEFHAAVLTLLPDMCRVVCMRWTDINTFSCCV